MASQISHIIYAKRFLATNLKLNLNEGEFLCGCVFPDIRRISEEIRRMKTHFVFEENCNMNGLNSFEAGWKFHIYCDKKRELLLKSLGFYNIKGTHSNEDASNKLLEDMLLYNQIHKDEWRKIQKMLFDKADSNDFPASTKEAVNRWYLSIAEYIDKKPEKESFLRLLSDFNTSKQKSLVIVSDAYNLKRNKEVTGLFKTYFKIFSEIFSVNGVMQ